MVVRDGAPVQPNGKTLSSKVSSFVRNNDLLAGINALPFYPVSDKEGEDRTNVGIVISDGVILSPPNSKYDALVFYEGGGAAVVPQAILSDTDRRITEAVGGFYQVLQDGNVSKRTENKKERHPRSAAGISEDGKFLYLIVIDGRRYGSIGATEAETGFILKRLGAYSGINFDGGGSSSLAVRRSNGLVETANTPVHGGIQGRERAVAGCLGVGARIFEEALHE
jgi:exopolysaccharide biosynthesis protein